MVVQCVFFCLCVVVVVCCSDRGNNNNGNIIDNYDDKDKQCHNKDEAVQHNNINANAH